MSAYQKWNVSANASNWFDTNKSNRKILLLFAKALFCPTCGLRRVRVEWFTCVRFVEILAPFLESEFYCTYLQKRHAQNNNCDCRWRTFTCRWLIAISQRVSVTQVVGAFTRIRSIWWFSPECTETNAKCVRRYACVEGYNFANVFDSERYRQGPRLRVGVCVWCVWSPYARHKRQMIYQQAELCA